MKRFALLFFGLAAAGCAGNETDGNGGAGGAATTASVASSSVGGLVVASSSGSGEPCGQDCSTIVVPACFEATCNAATQACEIKSVADDTPCEDGLFCTVDDKCDAGICKPGTPMVCTPDGSDPCVTSVCDEENGMCAAAPAVNGTACTSTDICESDAICQNGHCLGAPKDCSSTPLPDDCHVAGCEPATGDCIVLEANDGDACFLGDPCEADKICTAGVCGGTPIAGCTLCAETEQNGTVATANVDASCSVWEGAISVIGDQDFYGVHVGLDGSRIDAEVNDLTGPGSCPIDFSATVTVWSPTGIELAQDTYDGVFPCGHVGPFSFGATDLPVGDYFVSVHYDGNFSTSPPYLLTIDVLPPTCGNGIAEGTEQCDGFALDGQDCVSQGFGSGTLSCDASCNFVTSACSAPFCGDGFVQPGEDCEGFDLQGNTCLSVGFGSGTLSCASDCSFDTAACNLPACGDGFVQTGEECDDGNALNTDGCNTSCHVPACPPGQTRVSVASSAVPIAIFDNATFTDTIAISQTGTIQSLYLMLDITHSYDGDLDISLAPPGTALPGLDVTSDNGNGEHDFSSTLFSSTATTSITAGSGPFTGLWLPEASFAPLNGTSVTGTWTLTVHDDSLGDTGTLDQWRVIACVN